jgi:hypothetical protein
MKTYTSKERVNAAMNLQHPDRVPLMCQFSIGSMMTLLEANPVEFWYNKNVFADGLIRLCRMFRFDGILVSLHGHSDIWKMDLLSSESIKDGVYKLTYPNRTELHSRTDLPMVAFNLKKDLPAIEDFDVEGKILAQINYIPVSHNLYFNIDHDDLFGIFDIIHAKVGDSLSVHGEITSPFDYFLDLFGYENGLVALIMEPDKCKSILQRFTIGIQDLAVKMCDKHIDAIKISSPFAGMGFISSDQYTEFVLPFERQIIEAIRAKGVHAYIHTCGSINDRLEIMRESKTSGLECLDPVPVGNVDLKDAFERVGNELFIKGNIDSVNTLLYGSDEKAASDVKQILETGMQNGKGFILSTACSIAPMVAKERLLMLSLLIDEFGQYE